ncbi:HMA2 domain-containing protein [Aliivibrio kagoshimensis]|uniref:HMA2 domain-containing protein n=1 Tax=Aliivibrio kagoshimensis TaxID=2910230 RepID=UPI003D11C0C3
MKTYIHKTDHRLRVRSDYIKNQPKEVSELIGQLKKIDSVTHIKYKKHAGSVAISFDRNVLDCESLLEILESHQWTESGRSPSFVENAMVSGTKTLVKGVTGLMLSRLVGTSLSRAIMNLS